MALRRSGRTLFVLIGLSLLGAALCVVGLGAVIMSSFRHSDAYIGAVARAVANPSVVSHLGAPIAPGFFTTGSIKLTNSDGDAQLEIPLHGSLGSGKLNVSAEKTRGVWTYSRLTFRTERDFIDLLADTSAAKPPT